MYDAAKLRQILKPCKYFGKKNTKFFEIYPDFDVMQWNIYILYVLQKQCICIASGLQVHFIWCSGFGDLFSCDVSPHGE